MARETLKDFLTSIGSSADRIDFVRTDKPDGLGVDPNTGKELLDLLNSTEGLVGDYLNHLIENSSNTFKVEPGNELAAPSNRGESLVLAEEQGASNVFVPQGTEKASKLNEYSNSRYFDNAGQGLQNLIDKTGKDSDSHNLLADIEGRPLDTSGVTNANRIGVDNIVVKSTQSVFLNNNRFANAAPISEDSTTARAFAPNDGSVEEFENYTSSTGTIAGQKTFGVYNKTDYKTSFSRLRNVAGSLLLRSTGFLQTDVPFNDQLAEDLIDLAETAVQDGTNRSDITNPSAGFVKREVGALRARNQHGFPDEQGRSIRDGRGEFHGVDPEAQNSKSFGSTYNHVVQFDGASRTVVKIQAAIAVLSLKAVAMTFFETFKTYLKEEDAKALKKSTDDFMQSHDKTQVGLFVLGQSKKMSSLLLDAGLFQNILTATTYPYANCVDRGLEIAFSTAGTAEKIGEHQNFAQSPGFWFAVAKSVLKSYDNIVNRLNQIDTASFKGREIIAVMREIIGENNFLRFINVMATIGDVSLQSTNGLLSQTSRKAVKHPRDVDSFSDLPGNRVAKSRVNRPKGPEGGAFDNDAAIVGEETLAWEQSSTPSAYLMPVNVIRAANLLNNSVYGASPMRGMLGSRMARNTYFSIDVDGTFNRIPQSVVKILEDKLEAEYVPFYMHDLRTNEILSFHAFLDTLTDSINTNFNAVNGYGRLDPVQIYNNTTRNLQVGFTLYATNREDFDEMWYKINKFVTMLYPQWTQGTMVGTEGSQFYQPFSQVIGASPIIRLRIGDVIKTNYSRFGLARIFGIGDKEVQARLHDGASFSGIISTTIGATAQKVINAIRDVLTLIFVGLLGSPLGLLVAAEQLIPGKTGLGGTAKRLGFQLAQTKLAEMLVNGFVNPLAVSNVISDLRDPNVFNDAGISNSDPARGKRVFVKANNNTGYFSPTDDRKHYTLSRLRAIVIGRDEFQGKVIYKVKVVDDSSDLAGQDLHVAHQDILIEPGEHFRTSVGGIAAMVAGLDAAGALDVLMKPIVGSSAVGGALYALGRSLIENPESAFMQPNNNPFVRAFDSTKGRGLAGVMKGITFNWIDEFPWETDYNARAPMGVKISFNFDVIHDIPPGLSHDGYNRAPLYNVGQVMRNVAGDTYSDDGRGGEGEFVKGREVRSTGRKEGKS